MSSPSQCTQSDIEDIDTNENAPQNMCGPLVLKLVEKLKALRLLSELSEQDSRDNSDLFTSSTTSSLHVRYEGPASRGEIEYRKLLRGLNTKKKRQIVMFHRSWCKKAVIALKVEPIEPYRIFVRGVGKTHVFKLIQSDTIKLLGTIQPDDVIV